MSINKIVTQNNEEIHYKTNAGQVVRADGKTVQDFFDNGGTVNGNIEVKGNIAMMTPGGYSFDVIKIMEGNSNGSGIAIQGGGTLAIGSGESANNIITNIEHALSQETLYVGSDTSIEFKTNCNTIADAVTTTLQKDGKLLLSNELHMNNKAIRLINSDTNPNPRIGIDANTDDVFIANVNNNWLRLKPDATMSYAGGKVYTAKDKPTPEELGFTLSSGTNGYTKLPNGLIIQWGMNGTAQASVKVNFPITYPNSCFMVTMSPYTATATYGASSIAGADRTGFTYAKQYNSLEIRWIAIGY